MGDTGRQKSIDEQLDEKLASLKEEFDKQLSSLKRIGSRWGRFAVFALIIVIGVSIIYIAFLGTKFQKAVDGVNASCGTVMTNVVTELSKAVDSVVVSNKVIGVSDIEKLTKAIDGVKDATAMGKATLEVKCNNLLSADYLAIVIPVLLTFGGSLITFLGMSRLKTIDDRIERIRSEMLEEVGKRVESAANLAKATFEKEHSGELDKWKSAVDSTIQKGLAELKQEHDEKAKSFEELANGVEQKYGWLKEVVKEQKVGDLDIATVADAHNAVETLRDKKPNGYVSAIKKIVEKICSGEGITSGDNADYHNLAAELARGSMYSEAIKVLQKGLTLFKRDTDLLSDLVEYATNDSQFQVAEEAVKRLHSIDEKQWTWRCYEFVVDYYRAVGELDEAYKMCLKGIEALPYDEHAYRSKAELERMLNPGAEGVELAIETLESALQKGFPAAQCALRLSTLYRDKGEYQKAIDAASRSIMDCASDQPSVSVAAVIAGRGFAYEMLYTKKRSSGESGLEEKKSAIEDYKTALGLQANGVSDLSLITLKQIISRLRILGQDGILGQDDVAELSQDDSTESGQDDTTDA